MRNLIVVATAVVIGVAAAWGATQFEFRRPENPVPPPSVNANDPRVEVEGGDRFDFKTMQLGETQSHSFVFRNVGGSALELTAGLPSCKCTIAEIKGNPIPPGGEAEVVVSWTPKMPEDRFQQTAPIHTNDPAQLRVELKIGGHVRDSYKMEPATISLGQFSTSESHPFPVKVWGFQEAPWKLQNYTCVTTETAEFFNVETRDMTAEEIKEMPGARNGQILTVTIKQGISFGNIHQKFNINFRSEKEGTAELTMHGKAVGDITVLGKDFSEEHDAIVLGNLQQGQTRKATVALRVKGPYREQVQLKIKSIDPATSLHARLGEPKSGGKSGISWPLTVEIPADAESVNRLGTDLGRLARIEFDTGSSDVPDFTLKLRFAITADK